VSVFAEFTPSSSPALRRFVQVGRLEGLSFLVLVLVAMPLKYLAGWPVAVKYVGWVHGLLFVVFCAALLGAARAERWNFLRLAVAFSSGFVPGGAWLFEHFFLDRWAATAPAQPTPTKSVRN
jgi:integral membrane protein